MADETASDHEMVAAFAVANEVAGDLVRYVHDLGNLTDECMCIAHLAVGIRELFNQTSCQLEACRLAVDRDAQVQVEIVVQQLFCLKELIERMRGMSWLRRLSEADGLINTLDSIKIDLQESFTNIVELTGLDAIPEIQEAMVTLTSLLESTRFQLLEEAQLQHAEVIRRLDSATARDSGPGDRQAVIDEGIRATMALLGTASSLPSELDVAAGPDLMQQSLSSMEALHMEDSVPLLESTDIPRQQVLHAQPGSSSSGSSSNNNPSSSGGSRGSSAPENDSSSTRNTRSSGSSTSGNTSGSTSNAQLSDDQLICPICLDRLTDPVIIETGQTFDRECIKQYFAKGGMTCPVTRAVVSDRTKLVPNFAVRQLLPEPPGGWSRPASQHPFTPPPMVPPTAMNLSGEDSANTEPAAQGPRLLGAGPGAPAHAIPNVYTKVQANYLCKLPGNGGFAAQFSPCGQYLAASGGFEEETAVVWHVATRQLLFKLSQPTSAQWCSVAWAPFVMNINSGWLLASEGADGGDPSIRLWCLTPELLEIGNPPHQLIEAQGMLKGHTDGVQSMAFLDSSHLISGAGDSTVRIWDAERQVQLAVLEGHTDVVNSVAVCPHQQWVVSGSGDKTVRVWDVRSHSRTFTMEGHSTAVHRLAATPDGHYAATCSLAGRSCRVWDLRMGRELHKLTVRNRVGMCRSVISISMLPDSRTVIFRTDDGSMHVHISLAGGHCIGRQKLVPAAAICKDFYCGCDALTVSPDGRLLGANANPNGPCHLYQLEYK